VYVFAVSVMSTVH